MSIEAMRQARNAFVWNLNTDLDNIPACDKWAKMLRENIDNLDKALEQSTEQIQPSAYSNTHQQSTEQEPVAWMHPDGRLWTFGKGFDKSTFTIPLYTTPPQPEERNFCSRCGKRTADLTVIHTCTPPQENA